MSRAFLKGGTPVIVDAVWWGCRPHWAGAKIPQSINVKAETVATSRQGSGDIAASSRRWMVRVAIHQRPKTAELHHAKRHQTFYLADIWTERDEDKPLGVAIITEPARDSAKDVHDRMPLALDNDSLEPWLEFRTSQGAKLSAALLGILTPILSRTGISTTVNKPGRDSNAELNNSL